MGNLKACTSLMLAAALLISGCAPRRTPYDALYANLQEAPAPTDSDVLRGRRIVIDPGHGGYFDGAIGPDSLREADVNLGVALYLWGLLKEAGADVHLTRTTDRDFLPEESTELRDDLEARMDAANALEPEVFISLHHNSHITPDRDRNMVEIYYRSDDPGASLELARDIHLHLARNLGIEETTIKPGSYFVLRKSNAHASVLGEASYISHPAVEQKLKISNKQRLEAEAYFLGLVHFFSRGVPVITRIEPKGDTLAAPCSIAFAVEQPGGVPLDPASARIIIGDKEYAPDFSTNPAELRVSLDPDLPNAAYSVRATIKSIRGATAGSKPVTLLLSRPAAHVIPLPASRETGSSVKLGIKFLDAFGRPVADGVRVTAASRKTGGRFEGSCRGGVFHFSVDSELAAEAFVIEAPGRRDTIKFDVPGSMQPNSILVIDARTGESIPFPSAAGLLPRSSELTLPVLAGDELGRLLPDSSSQHDRLAVFADGYRPDVLTCDEGNAPRVCKLDPVFNGVLKGKRIAVDPGGGGADDGGSGENKLRGASVNLEVARLLGGILKNCGAKISMTRTGEETLSPEERIYHVNRFRADIAVGIRHESPPETTGPSCLILHYPGSAAGTALARELASTLTGLPPCREFRVMGSAGVFLQQTSCPACEIHCGSVGKTPHERIFTNPHFTYLEAERIFAALVEFFDPEETTCMTKAITVMEGGEPVPGATVCVDRVLTGATDESGIARFTCINPGMHLVSCEAPDGRLRFLVHDFAEDDPSGLIVELSPK
jgi:N-acetylmuramoyl-L-alanine amidase